MSIQSKFTSRQRQLVPLQPIPADKKPYIVRDMPDTIVYLTPDQAANRFDLIPQSKPLPVSDEITSVDWVESERW
ncbi:hypothetical protein ACFSUS_21485 [Spirosoma soli]|uniref:Prevent-host-death protein n=1 Tax=Spirosoma soli TaxID=1770529 RepID=A0ABW5M8D4_9BACT